MTDWREAKLGDILTLQRGFDLPARERIDGPFPIVSSAGVTGSHATFKVQPPGVVIGRYGSLGSVHWVEEPFWPLNTSLWVKDFRGNDPRFISYLLRTVTVDGSTASAVPGVNRNHLHRLPIMCPSIEVQRRIVCALAAFDELIEINERRIELLEDLARSLYREWFVRFRFPGNREARFADSSLGRIPSTWNVVPTDAVLTVAGGATPSKKISEYWAGGTIPWFTPSDLTRTRVRYVRSSGSCITPAGLANSGAQVFPPGSVLMTSRATLGVLAVTTLPAACNQGFIVITPTKGVSSEFIYQWLSSQRDQLETIATGATFKEITKRAFKQVPFLLADQDVLDEFERATQPIGDRIHACELQIRELAAARDLLLPRLVTGRLDISDIDVGDLLPAEAA